MDDYETRLGAIGYSRWSVIVPINILSAREPGMSVCSKSASSSNKILTERSVPLSHYTIHVYLQGRCCYLVGGKGSYLSGAESLLDVGEYSLCRGEESVWCLSAVDFFNFIIKDR